jgi:hypothetical protein
MNASPRIQGLERCYVNEALIVSMRSDRSSLFFVVGSLIPDDGGNRQPFGRKFCMDASGLRTNSLHDVMGRETNAHAE